MDYEKDFVEEVDENEEEELSSFDAMKRYIDNGAGEGQFGYDDPYVDYVDGLYSDAVAQLSEEYPELFIEPSIQCGRGGVFLNYEKDGITYLAEWDFESECDTLFDLAEDSNTEEEFLAAIISYLRGHCEEAEAEEEEMDDMEIVQMNSEAAVDLLIENHPEWDEHWIRNYIFDTCSDDLFYDGPEAAVEMAEEAYIEEHNDDNE